MSTTKKQHAVVVPKLYNKVQQSEVADALLDIDRAVIVSKVLQKLKTEELTKQQKN